MKYPAGISGEAYEAMEDGYEQGYRAGYAARSREVERAMEGLRTGRAVRAGDASTGESPVKPVGAAGLREVVGRWLADSVTVTGDSGDQVSTADVTSNFVMWLSMVGEVQPAASKTVLREVIVDSMVEAGARWDRYGKKLVGVRL